MIHAEGEQQAAERLVEAATELAQRPESLQLRYLQTLIDIASDKSNTIVFPMPMSLVQALQGAAGVAGGDTDTAQG